MDFIIENVRVMQDTASTCKLVGYNRGQKVVVNNCHLCAAPYWMMRTSCLFGNYEYYQDGVYRCKTVFATYCGEGRYRVQARG